jgi:hypothetical protein
MTYVFIILLFCYKINFGHQYCVLRNYFTHEGTSQNENNRMKEATKKKNFILIASFRHQSYVIVRQYRFLQKKITRTFKKKQVTLVCGLTRLFLVEVLFQDP